MSLYGFKRKHGLSFSGLGSSSKGSSFLRFIASHKMEILMFLPFFIMDLSIRIMGYKIDFYPAYYIQPNLFTIIWTGLFIALAKYLKGVIGKIFYFLMFIISFVLFLTNAVYYSLTNFYFNFSLLELASEGSSYIADTIKNTPVYVYILAIFIFVLAIVAVKNMKKGECFQWKKLLAAQILQRTLFKYIAIKNNFFLFAGSVLAAFPVVPTADFSAESGAKISHLFETTKSFRKIFSEIFRTFFLIVSNRISYSKRVQR